MQGLIATFITPSGVRVESDVFLLLPRAVAILVGNVSHVVASHRVTFRSWREG